MPSFPLSDRACHQKKKLKTVFREVRTELASPEVNEFSTDHSNLINKGKKKG